MAIKSVFEHVTCSRCLGTGQYSYNQIDGSRCYGCQGSGVKYTKRGAAARTWWKAQTELRADQVTVGMVVSGMGYSKFLVKTIEPQEQKFKSGTDTEWRTEMWLSIQSGTHGMTVPPNYKLVQILKGAEAQELLQRAKAYQETLTQAGTVRK